MGTDGAEGGFGGLSEVLRFAQTPTRFGELRGIRQVLHLRMYDTRGGLLAEQTMTHEADLTQPDRDRMILTGDRVFGRNGPTVFAEVGGRPAPGLEHRAARQLQLYGLLVRAPWRFTEAHDFTVFPQDTVEWKGQRVPRVRIERRPRRSHDGGEVVGPLPQDSAVDRFELWCDPLDHRPARLRYTFAETGTRVDVELDRYRRVGGVPMPHLRRFLRRDGSVSMEVEVLSADVFEEFSDATFRPRR